MKPKVLFTALLVCAAAAVVALALWGRNYYANRYVGADYYAMVPLDYDVAQVQMRSMNGEPIGEGVAYSLTAYDETGKPKEVSFTVYSPESGLSRGEVQPMPGEFLWISASSQIVLRWRLAEAESIPPAAMEKIGGR
ncbi:MAG: YxeA family protein [Defluviitaleaceae bacterium]|nr:YxeA family protein [Defluviitaleaceae bacterium]